MKANTHLEECSELWKSEQIEEDLFGNYHYVQVTKIGELGHGTTLLKGEKLILVTDGLRNEK